MQPPAYDAIQEFLKECPEHIQGTRTKVIQGREEILFDTLTLVAFGRWSVARGYVPKEKAEAFLSGLRSECLRRGIRWPEEPER